ncbi:copper amine oxidase N-terminal domain-containing protein [Alkalicoccus chagannorensis]|uniref:copper amine oxidase N-terminal domain-containing protein n=1 Tax=Alkalicoccus chagannorensis TaxID=427072 RepID=UPI0003FFBB5D|nr:copper amine oxidase N-terminal domain-containing protein [Alkalicoccus chagannorensis]
MKKVLGSIGLLAALLAAPAAAGASNLSIDLNGEALNVDGPDPILENGVTFVPLRGVLEEMGADVSWQANPSPGTVHVRYVDTTIEAPLQQTEMMVNGEPISLQAPLRLIHNRTMLPLRAIAESMGAQVRWNHSGRTVEVEQAFPDDLVASGMYEWVENERGNKEVVDAKSGETVAMYRNRDRMLLYSSTHRDMLAAGELAVEYGFPLTREDFSSMELMEQRDPAVVLEDTVQVRYFTFGGYGHVRWEDVDGSPLSTH